MKKLLTVTMSLLMLFSVFFIPIETVNAANVHNDVHVHETTIGSTIIPLSQSCGNCRRGVLIETKERGQNWYAIGEVKCTHGYGHGTDIIEGKSVTIVLKCNVCGIGTSYAGTPDTRTICHGFN